MRRAGMIAAALAVGANALAAQDNFIAIPTYEISIPLGDTKDFVSPASWVGLGWEGRWLMARHATAGFAVGVNEFSERFNGTTNFPSGSATGPQFRYLLSIPVLGTAHYYFGDVDGFRLSVGAGAGIGNMRQVYELGSRQLSRNAWHWILAPEIGTQVLRLGSDLTGLVSLRYNWQSAAGDYVGGGARSFDHLTLRLGVGERW